MTERARRVPQGAQRGFCLPDRRPRTAVWEPKRLEALCSPCDGDASLDALLDLLDDPATPPDVVATIRDWMNR